VPSRGNHGEGHGSVEAERASVAGRWLWVDVCIRRLLRLPREGVPACFGRSACSADGVRGCPRDPPSGCQRPRTYGGQRRRGESHSAAFAQVRGYVMGRGVAVCKTVGSAYVGSNPTPATTCGNGPLAAETRPAGRFLLVTPCISVCHRESTRCGIHGRIADGVRGARTVGAHRRLFHGRPRTGRAGGVFRLDVRRRTGRTSPVSAPAAGCFRGGAAGRRCADG
jgi:hypothetical protein